MRALRDELFDWILTLGPTAKFNLASSGLTDPRLRQMGVNTSFEDFAAEKVDQEQAFAEEVARLYRVEPSNVLATAGGSEAIFLAYSTFGAGRRAVVPLPNYPVMFTLPRALGMKVESSAKGAPAGSVLALPDPNTPTGRAIDPGALDRRGSSGRRGGGVVYINETYKEFAFAGSPLTSFGEDGVVTSGTMTKFYGLGRLRVGWILADDRKIRQLLYTKWAVSGHDSEYSLWIARQVLRRRTAFVDRARRTYMTNSRLVRRFLEETKGVSAEVGVAPFCLDSYSRGLPSVPLARKVLRETGVLISPGDFFGAPRSFRLCFTAGEEALRGGLEALSSFVSGRGG